MGSVVFECKEGPFVEDGGGRGDGGEGLNVHDSWLMVHGEGHFGFKVHLMK